MIQFCIKKKTRAITKLIIYKLKKIYKYLHFLSEKYSCAQSADFTKKKVVIPAKMPSLRQQRYLQ